MRFPDRGRHKIPLPIERQAEQPFAYDPASGRIVAPWPKGRLSAADERRLDAVIERIAEIEADTMIWIWPDGRAPVPVAARDPRWLLHWARDRASYSAGA